MFKCRDISELATDYLEGNLSLRNRAAFHLHLMICDPCRGYLHNLRQTIQLIHSAQRAETLPEAVLVQIDQQIEQALRANEPTRPPSTPQK